MAIDLKSFGVFCATVALVSGCAADRDGALKQPVTLRQGGLTYHIQISNTAIASEAPAGNSLESPRSIVSGGGFSLGIGPTSGGIDFRGRVVFRVLIDRSGNVTGAFVDEADGWADHDQQSVKRFLFEPLAASIESWRFSEDMNAPESQSILVPLVIEPEG